MQNQLVFTAYTPEEFKSIFKSLLIETLEEVQPTAPPPAQLSQYLTAKEVCEVLQISNTTLHDWKKKGRITAKKVAQSVRYDRDEILKLFSNHQKFKRI